MKIKKIKEKKFRIKSIKINKKISNIQFDKFLNIANRKELIKKQLEIKDTLIKKYNNLINKYKCVEENYAIENCNNIWICWWQGIESAPDIVKKCVENVKKYSKNKNIIILNKYNYKQYIDIPEYILEKLENKNMSITHFSDVLRINVLNKYGGTWLDSTCFITDENYINEKYDFYTVKLPYNKKEPCISKGKWCVFFLKGTKQNVLFQFMKEFYDEYWKIENEVIDYYLMDYIIEIAYENIPAVHKMIDKVPENNYQIHTLKNKLNTEFNEIEYMKLLETNNIHKLAHEKHYIPKLANGKRTFYGYIMGY